MNIVRNLKGCKADPKDVEMYLKQFKGKYAMHLEKDGMHAVIRRVGNGKIEIYFWCDWFNNEVVIEEKELKDLACLFEGSPRAYYFGYFGEEA
jgi:hypothetical protein